jgi:hypothetical protein
MLPIINNFEYLKKLCFIKHLIINVKITETASYEQSTHQTLRLSNRPDRNRDSSVGIATSYGLDGRWVGVRVPVETSIFYFPIRPDRFWGPPSLLSNGYRGYLSAGVKMTTQLHLVPRSRKYGYIHPYPHTSSLRSA